MKIELHAIQSFAPSNLNRDDNGAPKSAMFGDYRRARISSQSLKRAMRDAFGDDAHLQGYRTKLIVAKLEELLTLRGMSVEDALVAAKAAVEALNLKLVTGDKTEFLLFVSDQQLEEMADTISGNANVFLSAAGNKKDQRAKLLLPLLKRGHSADIALFGRMIASSDRAELNVDGAAQFAHAISTHRVDVEYDYFTAVDDLQSDEEPGAGMLGHIAFNAACVYRYASVDTLQLCKNLDRDTAKVQRALQVFLHTFITVVPSGKQNSMAAHNPPTFILAVMRNSGNWSLANAFVRPVRKGNNTDVVTDSIKALDTHWGDLTTVYGTDGTTDICCIAVGDDARGALRVLKEARVDTLKELIARILAAVPECQA